VGETVRGPADLVARLDTVGEVVGRVPGVLFAYLFGSAALEQMRPSSDVDLAVYLDPSTDALEARLAVAAVASKHLGMDQVDVVVLNAAPLALAGRVLATRRVIVDGNPFARQRYESVIIRAFADFRLVERRHFDRRHHRG